MLVKTAVKDTKDAYYTLTVTRGYDNTKANSHLANEYGGPTEIYLEMTRNSGWSQLIASPNWSLITENASFLDDPGNFSGMSQTASAGAGTGSAAAALPTANIPTGRPAAANAWIAFPGVSPSGGDLLGMPLRRQRDPICRSGSRCRPLPPQFR